MDCFYLSRVSPVTHWPRRLALLYPQYWLKDNLDVIVIFQTFDISNVHFVVLYYKCIMRVLFCDTVLGILLHVLYYAWGMCYGNIVFLRGLVVIYFLYVCPSMTQTLTSVNSLGKLFNLIYQFRFIYIHRNSLLKANENIKNKRFCQKKLCLGVLGVS